MCCLQIFRAPLNDSARPHSNCWNLIRTQQTPSPPCGNVKPYKVHMLDAPNYSLPIPQNIAFSTSSDSPNQATFPPSKTVFICDRGPQDWWNSNLQLMVLLSMPSMLVVNDLNGRNGCT